MQRIAIIGSGGSGKSTLARQMGARLQIEVIHLDALFWHPGWIETPRDRWAAMQQELVARPCWIIDGGYSGTMDLRFAAADTIIFLDLSRWICLWRVIKRRVRYHGRSRPDMAAGCPEQLGWQFVRWIWDYPRTRRPRILGKLAALPNKQIIHLRSRAEVNHFVHQLTETHISTWETT